MGHRCEKYCLHVRLKKCLFSLSQVCVIIHQDQVLHIPLEMDALEVNIKSLTIFSNFCEGGLEPKATQELLKFDRTFLFGT